ncbi:MAG: ComF family protein [Bacteroidaceae bacterium]|nr:ComF family protein [Bacteroidaceae bacterium]
MNLLADLYNILMPRRCVVCQTILEPSEQYLCTACSIQMPRYPLHSIEDNEPLRKAWNFAPIQYGATLLYYRHHSNFHKIITNIKYKGNEQLGIKVGEWAAMEIAHLQLAEKVDVIVPVPSDKNRKKKRGYNQAELIAEGMGRIMQRPVKNFLVKKESGMSQTRLNKTERRENTTGKFEADIPLPWRGKHILLVDDVLTTGATIGNCAQALLAADSQAKISIFPVAYNA